MNKQAHVQSLSAFPKNRRGDITMPVLIGIIILIASVALIFIFWDRLDLGNVGDETLCYNSVISRASVLELSKDIAAPALNCKTGYYCISKDGTCEMMSSSTNIIKVETADDVYGAISEKMASCWSQFGEGRYDYIGEKLSKSLYCSNCYQIGLDDSLDMFSEGKIDQRELYRYMSKTNVSGTDSSYLDYLIGINAETIENGLDSAGSEFGSFNIGKQYFVVMGIYSDIAEWKTAVLGGATAVGVFSLLTLTTIVTGGAAIPGILVIVGATGAGAVGGAAGYFVGTIAEGESGQQFLTPTLVETNSQDYSNLNCSSIATLS